MSFCNVVGRYEDALIIKSFAFSFINSYATLFFYAFIVLMFPETSAKVCPTGCMATVSTTLITLFMTRLTTGNVQEVLLPYLKQRKKLKQVEEASNQGLSQAELWMNEPMTAVEEQFLLDNYDILLGMFGDYLEMIIQFGYATLFSAAFLFAPLLAYINNYVEIRVDAWKITTLCRRPFPKAAEDVGSWQVVMEIMGVCAVVTNVALLCFTSTIMSNLSSTGKFVVFAFMEHALIGLKIILEVAIDDIPEEVEIQKERNAYYVDRVILRKEDDALDIQEYEKTVEGKVNNKLAIEQREPNLNIKLTDLEYVRKGAKERRMSLDALNFDMDLDEFRSPSQYLATSGMLSDLNLAEGDEGEEDL